MKRRYLIKGSSECDGIEESPHYYDYMNDYIARRISHITHKVDDGLLSLSGFILKEDWVIKLKRRSCD